MFACKHYLRFLKKLLLLARSGRVNEAEGSLRAMSGHSPHKIIRMRSPKSKLFKFANYMWIIKSYCIAQHMNYINRLIIEY